MIGNIKRICVLSSSPFPQRSASVTRIITYCKGLVQNNVKCDVFLFRPNVLGNGIPMINDVEGIRFMYAHQRNPKKGNIFKHFIDRPLSLFRTIIKINKQNKEEKYDYIFISFDLLKFLYFFVPILRSLRFKLIFIGDEYPFEIRTKGKNKISSLSAILYKIIFYFINARILINEKLKEYYNRLVGVKPSHILPSIVDVDRFKDVKIVTNGKKYLCYLGGLDLLNDNVDLIIEAFNKIHTKYSDIDLFLYGTAQQKDYLILNNIINKYRLTNRVFFKGSVGYNVVPFVLSNAFVLVTSQSNSKRAEGGVPTKIGEYLMSGVPSIVSDVSNISEVFKHKQHLFIVKPDNIDLYVECLEYIINNYNEAKRIAVNGRNYIIQNYNSKRITYELLMFLNKI